MSDSGGAIPRRGFSKQDLAAAYHFLVNTEAEELHIEKYESDFAFFLLAEEPPQKHFFEVKSGESGNYTWGKFKRKVAPEFAEIAEEEYDEETFLGFHLVAVDQNFGRKLNNFFDDVERLQKNQMSWSVFETKHGRDELQKLENAVEQSEIARNKMINGLIGNKHSEKELELGIEKFLKKCSRFRHTNAKKIILDKIGRTDSGTIKRRELEQLVGFDLEPQYESETDIQGVENFQQLRQEIKNVEERHDEPKIETETLAKEKKVVSQFAGMMPKNDEDEMVVEAIQSDMDENFEELLDLKIQMKNIKQNISQGASNLLELDISEDKDEE